MPRNFTTPNQVKALKPGLDRYDARDTEERGLELRVYPSGSRVWSFRYGINGKDRRAKLGLYPGVTLTEARAKAKKLAGEVAENTDPEEARQRAAREAKEAASMATLAEEWLADCSARLRPATMREYRRKLAVEILPAWRSRPAREIGRADVIRLLKQVRKQRGNVTANRTRALLAAMFSYAVSADVPLIEASPAVALPKSTRSAESPRQRVLASDEIAKLWAALTEMDRTSPGIADAWRLVLLTAARPGEVLKMRWRDLTSERDGAWWNLSAEQTKQRRAHRYPLSPEALAIIEAWRPLTGRDPWVLPSRRAGQPLTWLSHSAERLRERTELPRFTAHDARRSAGTILRRDLGQSADLVEDLLGHSRGRLQQTYQTDKDERAMRRAVELLGKHVVAVAAGREHEAELLPFKR